MSPAEAAKPEHLLEAKGEIMDKAYVAVEGMARPDPVVAIDEARELQRVTRILRHSLQKDRRWKDCQ